MKVVRFVTRLTKRVVWWVLVPYFVYLVFFGCALDIVPSNALAQYTCPPLRGFVYPSLNTYVYPPFSWADKNLHISSTALEKLQPLKESWTTYDDTYQVTHNLAAVYTAVARHVARFYHVTSYIVSPYWSVVSSHCGHHYQTTMRPLALYYGAKYKYAVETSVDSAFSYLLHEVWVVFEHTRASIGAVYARYLGPTFTKIGNTLYSFSVVRKLYLGSNSLFQLFLEQSSIVTASLQSKRDFIMSEFLTFGQSSETKKRSIHNRDELNTVVSSILDNFTEVRDFSKESVETSNSDVDQDSSDLSEEEEIITLTQTRTVTVTVETDEAENESSENVSESESSEIVENDSLEEPLVESISEFETSGETGLTVPEPIEEDVLVYGSDSSQSQLEYELSYWQTRVQKALDLAANSIEADFGPYLNETIETLKNAISANFTLVQTDNYLRYKEMGELIVKINKDAEYIRQTNLTIDEPEVGRQIMRDKIAAAYALPEAVLRDVEQNLNEAHVAVMTEYFKVAQETVDVLESFADTAISDFSSRLTGLLDILKSNDDFDDAMIWSAWKSFHKVKESIFEIRDQIFDEANAYKFNARGSKVPRGLASWADYLAKASFHVSFLLRDNAEYMQLVRAKANVAYQEREGLTYSLQQAEEARKAQAEAELKEKARQEEAESKRRLAEEAETRKRFEEEAELRKKVLAQEEEAKRNALVKEAEEAALKEREEAVKIEETEEVKEIEEAEEADKIEKIEERSEAPVAEESQETSAVEPSDVSSEPEAESYIAAEDSTENKDVESKTEEEVDSLSAQVTEVVESVSEEHIEYTSESAVETTSLESTSSTESVAESPAESLLSPKNTEPEFEALEYIPQEASENDEFVQEADESLEMAGERAPPRDEL